MTSMNINETGRLAISMKSLVRDNPTLRFYPLSDETIILLVHEQRGCDGPVWSIAAEPQWAYSALGTICRDRAFLAEQGHILVDGKRLKAEPYLTLWRKATYSPMEWANAVSAGIIISVTVSLPAAYVADVLAGNTREEALRDFLGTAIGTSATVDEANRTWTLPMDSIDNMLAFASLCNCYPGPQKYGHGKQVTFKVERRTVEAGSANSPDSDPSAQNDLFAEAA